MIRCVPLLQVYHRLEIRPDGPLSGQGHSGSCTANAICSAWRLAQHNIDPGFHPSRLFLFYNERKMEGHANDKGGAHTSDGCKSLENNGLCRERTWPFDVDKITVRPPRHAYEEAKEHMIHTPAQLEHDTHHVKDSLAQGKPVLVGIVLFSNFHDARHNGVVPMPDSDSQKKGGHAVLIVGYDDHKRHWIVRNSWGKHWGDEG